MAKKRIHHSKHSKERMESRGISEGQVSMTITNPDEELPTRGKDRKRARKEFGTKTLDVIYADEGKKDAVIVTTYWTKSKPKTITR